MRVRASLLFCATIVCALAVRVARIAVADEPAAELESRLALRQRLVDAYLKAPRIHDCLSLSKSAGGKLSPPQFIEWFAEGDWFGLVLQDDDPDSAVGAEGAHKRRPYGGPQT
jgi:hypothetical protein